MDNLDSFLEKYSPIYEQINLDNYKYDNIINKVWKMRRILGMFPGPKNYAKLLGEAITKFFDLTEIEDTPEKRTDLCCNTCQISVENLLS
jgi:hypothetical protein